jgi:hypothetical protein
MDFREFPTGEVRRIPLPRTPVNKGLASPGRRPRLERRPVLSSNLGWLLFYAYLEAAVAVGTAGGTWGAAPPDWASFIPPLR